MKEFYLQIADKKLKPTGFLLYIVLQSKGLGHFVKYLGGRNHMLW